MNQTVAVLVNENGTTSDIFSGKQFEIYLVDGEQFILTDTLQYKISGKASLCIIRRELTELIEALSAKLDCNKIIVGSDVSGLPYNIFDSAGYTIFEIEGEPKQFLENLGIQFKNQQMQIKEGETIVFTDRPIEITDGIYYFDLKTLQIKKPGITSKQALMPFFTSIPFVSLDIICAHIPPWFDREFGRLNLTYTTKKLNGALRVTVLHNLHSEQKAVPFKC